MTSLSLEGCGGWESSKPWWCLHHEFGSSMPSFLKDCVVKKYSKDFEISEFGSSKPGFVPLTIAIKKQPKNHELSRCVLFDGPPTSPPPQIVVKGWSSNSVTLELKELVDSQKRAGTASWMRIFMVDMVGTCENIVKILWKYILWKYVTSTLDQPQ